MWKVDIGMWTPGDANSANNRDDFCHDTYIIHVQQTLVCVYIYRTKKRVY